MVVVMLLVMLVVVVVCFRCRMSVALVFFARTAVVCCFTFGALGLS